MNDSDKPKPNAVLTVMVYGLGDGKVHITVRDIGKVALTPAEQARTLRDAAAIVEERNDESEPKAVDDPLVGDKADGGRITSKKLAWWLSRHRDNDVRMLVHGQGVPIGQARYHPNADAIELEPLEGEDLRIATSFCPDD